MKSGFLSSVGLHTLALAIAFISFNSVPKPIDNSFIEPLPITLVPISDKATIIEGDKTAPLSNKPTPKPITKPVVKPDAQNYGDGEVDTASLLKPDEKPRDINANQPTAGKPDAKPDMALPQHKPNQTDEQPKQQIIENQNKPEPIKPIKAKPVEPKPVLPKPVPAKPETAKPETAKTEAQQQEITTQVANNNTLATKPSDTKPPQQQQIVDPQPVDSKPEEPETPEEVVPQESIPQLPTSNAPIPGARPQITTPTTTPSPANTQKPATSVPTGQNVADIINNNQQNELIDRTPTQGGGAKRSEGEAGLGGSKNIGDQEKLQTMISEIIQKCVYNRWTLPWGRDAYSTESKVEADFTLSPDGHIIGTPVLKAMGGDLAMQRNLETSAGIALKLCSPFIGLPVESYQDWKYIRMNFQPNRNI